MAKLSEPPTTLTWVRLYERKRGKKAQTGSEREKEREAKRKKAIST